MMNIASSTQLKSPVEMNHPLSSWRSDKCINYVQALDVEEIILSYYPDLIRTVHDTYSSFYEGSAVNPDTYSLKFPEKTNSRINALPSYVGGKTDVAGLKWVASFPDNVSINKQRASALIIVNSYETGYPLAILDGTKISAARTVASALFAANRIYPQKHVSQISLYGAGLIHRELVTLMLRNNWQVDRFIINDPHQTSCDAFIQFCSEFDQMAIANDHTNYQSEIVSFATSALNPWYDEELASHALVLHMSLRDIVPNRLKSTFNVVDHIPHALKANTSLHLLDQSNSSYHIDDFRFFEKRRSDKDKTIVVSAFGMGMLDIAVAAYILDVAERDNKLLKIPQLCGSNHRW